MKNHIGLNIRFIYEAKKLSQEEFGEIFGLKKSAVSSYVNQRASPPYEVAIQIADHYGLSLDDLIRRPLNQGIFMGASSNMNKISPQFSVTSI